MDSHISEGFLKCNSKNDVFSLNSNQKYNSNSSFKRHKNIIKNSNSNLHESDSRIFNSHKNNTEGIIIYNI